MLKNVEFRNAYKLAEHHRDFARWMRDNGHEKIGGETPEDFERKADRIEQHEDSLRGLRRDR